MFAERAGLWLIAALCVFAAGCDGASNTPPPQSLTGHEKMLAQLKDIADRTPEEHPFYGRRQLRQWNLQLARPDINSSRKVSLHLQAARWELHLHNLAAGIDHLNQALRLLPPGGGDRVKVLENRTKFYLGVAYMRLGETENCCLRHSPESCIVPIRGGGLHTQQEGSRRAITYFLDVLTHPSASGQEAVIVHQGARWLLSIAYMTLGEYPDGVPKEFLIPPEVFESKIDFPRFKNIYPSLGLETFNLSGGAIVDDFDNDDYLDILTSTCDPEGQMQFFRNNRDGTFTERTREAGLTGLFGGLNMVHADYDNDGDVDVLVFRGAWYRSWGTHPNSLLRNNGDGTFTDVTFDAGLGRVHYPTKTGAWADYDNDGDVDLYIGNETTPDINAPGQLFRNNGDGTFTDVASEAGLQEHFFAMGAVWGDFDNDRFPDLYVSTEGDNRLYRNNRDGTFTNVAPMLGVTKPFYSFPVWFWDFDNDGALDLFVSASSGPIGILAMNPLGVGVEQQEQMQVDLICLYRGDGKGSFTDVAVDRNLTYPAQPMGANFGDLNNDGFLDFYLATGNVDYSEIRPNVMFLNQAGRAFVNVTMAGGFGHLQKGHAVSYADLDNDGDLDVYVQMGGAVPGDKYNDALFENPGFGHHWVTVMLEGRQSNRSAIGARIHARFEEDGSVRSVYRTVTSGGSFGANPLRQTIGLGTATEIGLLEIFWPTTGKTQSFKNVACDQVVRIVEGEDTITPVKLKKLKLSGAD